MKLSLRHRLQVYILVVFTIIFTITIAIISVKTKSLTYSIVSQLIESKAEDYSNQIESELEKDLSKIKTLIDASSLYKKFTFDEWNDYLVEIYKETLKTNPEFLSVWDSWELNKIDTFYTKTYGRHQNEVYKKGGSVKVNQTLKSLEGDEGTYLEIKTQKTDNIAEPYLYSYNDGHEILMTSIIAPMLEDNSFTGVIGVDIGMQRFQDIIAQIEPFKGSYAFLLSNKGVVVGHPNNELIGKPYTDIASMQATNLSPEELSNLQYSIQEILKKVNKGTQPFIEELNENNKEHFISFTPIQIGNSTTPWSLAISIPSDAVRKKARSLYISSIIIGIIGLVLVSISIYFLAKTILDPLQQITSRLKKLALGNSSEEIELDYKNEDEISDMISALKTSITGLNEKTNFSKEIGEGNLDTELSVLSDKDLLGQSLLNMRDNLILAKEDEEKRKTEDKKRRWINEGLAKFGDLMHQNNDDISEFTYSILSQLIQYIDINQGGIFLYNDDDKSQPFFELISSYAFNRRKFKERTILPGEGLVGTCALEKQTINITEIPNSYIEITSGLGGSNPNNLLLVPLKKEDEILGVIELAAFRNFEDYQIEFIEKISENLAATLSAVRTNIHTSMLLEKTQQQAEEMAAQEEEMRQNMEELQATQEESARKTAEMESLLSGLNSSSFVTEYDTNKRIVHANDRLLEFFKIDETEIVGTFHHEGLKLSDDQKIQYEQFWADLKNGLVKTETHKIEMKEKNYVFYETFIPLKDQNEDVIKIIKISNDITGLS